MGSEPAPGDVRPVSNQLVAVLGVVVVIAVALAIGAVIWASSSTKKPAVSHDNVPHGVSTSPTATPTPKQAP